MSLLFLVARLLAYTVVFDDQYREGYMLLLLETMLLLEYDDAFDAKVEIGNNMVTKLLP
jgi:hypothetical protein